VRFGLHAGGHGGLFFFSRSMMLVASGRRQPRPTLGDTFGSSSAVGGVIAFGVSRSSRFGPMAQLGIADARGFPRRRRDAVADKDLHIDGAGRRGNPRRTPMRIPPGSGRGR